MDRFSSFRKLMDSILIEQMIKTLKSVSFAYQIGKKYFRCLVSMCLCAPLVQR